MPRKKDPTQPSQAMMKVANATADHPRKRHAVLTEIVERNCNKSGFVNCKITDAHVEMVLSRVSAGDTLNHICEELGINAQLFRQKCRLSPELKRQLDVAKEFRADSHVDTLVEMAWDDTISPARLNAVRAVVEFVAKSDHRSHYGDKVQHDVRSLTINLPPDASGLF